MVKIYLFSLLISCAFLCRAQIEFNLYDGKVPNSIETQDEESAIYKKEVDTLLFKVSRPKLIAYLPSEEKANGSAVIICPGGGYHCLLISQEGGNVAKAFNKYGVTAFVLKYRLPSDSSMVDKSIGPLQDAQRAVQIVREHASEWHIDPGKVGIMGFSAGGHLAATTGTHFDNAVIDNEKGINLRPDFMILIYPVISFVDSICHKGSRYKLLGGSPTQEQVRYFSNEKHVCRNTPPAFITQANNDVVVPVVNSQALYHALRKNNVQAELHIYSKGGHGYLKQPPFEEWFGRCLYWMKSNGWL